MVKNNNNKNNTSNSFVFGRWPHTKTKTCSAAHSWLRTVRALHKGRTGQGLIIQAKEFMNNLADGILSSDARSTKIGKGLAKNF